MRLAALMVGTALMFGGATYAQEQAGHEAAMPAAEKLAGDTAAVAVLHPLGNSGVSGTVRFTMEGGEVKVVAEVEGLKPNTVHGFHIHEFGDCSSADGSSAGGHYNPQGHPHAGPADASHHAGDLGNLKSDESGKAKLELTVTGITINGSVNPIVGRSVIVHAAEDDLKTQPTGNSGARIACGVIGIAKAK